MSQRTLLIILILLVVGFGGYYTVNELMPAEEVAKTGPIFSTKEVIKGDINVGVETSGQLNASRDGGITVPGDYSYEYGGITYKLAEILVEEGDPVTAGQVIAKLDARDLENKIKEKEAEIELKRKQLAEITGESENGIEFMNPRQGISVAAPINGRITGMSIREGQEISLGDIIGTIIDDSKYKMTLQLTESEFKMLSLDDTVRIKFKLFESFYEGKITYINNNKMIYKDKDGNARGFVYTAEVEADNPGLVIKDMEADVSIIIDDGAAYQKLSFEGIVDGFVQQKNVFSTVKAVVTEIHVKDQQIVEKNEMLVTMAGNDIQEIIEDKTEEILEIKKEILGLQSQLEDTDVLASRDGIVARFYTQVGETVRPGDWIGSIFNTESMNMWTEIDDMDIIYVQQGAKVKVTVDALPNDVFEGEVENVSSYGEDRNGITKFMVSIKVTGNEKLKPGMQARAYIEAGSSEDCLLVPLEAIFEEDGKPMVEIFEDGTAKAIEIEIGLINNRYAEVISGIEEGALVITGSTQDLLPSQHIGSKDSILPASDGDKDKDNDGETPSENE